MTQKGFTLIELLVVVAIIGILAAVGVVAFTGFLNNAKINTLKANHSSVVDYIQSELWKCNIGAETEAYEKQQTNPSLYSGYGSPKCDRQFSNIAAGIIAYLHNYDEKGYDNPFNPNDTLETGINMKRTCPEVANIGRINVGLMDNNNEVIICSRWGSGEDDIIRVIIKNPFE